MTNPTDRDKLKSILIDHGVTDISGALLDVLTALTASGNDLTGLTADLEALELHGELSDALADRLAPAPLAAFYHLTSYSHRGDDVPTQYVYPVEVRRAAVSLALAVLTASGNEQVLREALERCQNFIANTESEMGEPLECGEIARAALSITPTMSAETSEAGEAYEIGKRDGYEQAVQDIDLATGGDGEFVARLGGGQSVDVPVMKQRIIDRCASTMSAETKAPSQ
jgi:hypothetical protein